GGLSLNGTKAGHSGKRTGIRHDCGSRDGPRQDSDTPTVASSSHTGAIPADVESEAPAGSRYVLGTLQTDSGAEEGIHFRTVSRRLPGHAAIRACANVSRPGKRPEPLSQQYESRWQVRVQESSF